ncbi:P-loop containing nucleoside triphosphate hydrolase protein [Schizophyllum fasciatum]
MQSGTPGLPNQPPPLPGALGNAGTPDIAPNQVISPGSLMQNNPMMNAGLPGRPSIAQARLGNLPNAPMRTWSTGNLDLPPRPADSVIRQSNVNDSLLGPKRRSVSGLQRRDSSGVLDANGEWSQGGSQRDGPVLSKWEQLPLTPELLRSLTKFGLGPPNKIQQRALPFLLRGSDIIAQAPPTQERIAAYVIPAIQIAVTHMPPRSANRGPLAILVSTTVDQATQAQRMIRDLGGPIGVRSALGVGAASANSDLSGELRLLQQNMPHIICGTPHKLHALFTSPGGLSGADVRFLVLDEVDQLIARNLHEFVFHIVKLLPPPRSRPSGGPSLPAPPPAPGSVFPDTPPAGSAGMANPFGGLGPGQAPRKYSLAPSPSNGDAGIERQTALFSNTVPQDVLNLATAINLKEPVRVLVRRDGNVTHSDNQGSRNLRQFYLYLAFTAGGGRTDAPGSTPGSNGLGIIGSGRGATSAESTQAREWKLDALADLFDDVEVPQAIVHVGGMTSLDAVVYKLASRGLEAVPLHGDMNAGTKLAALNKFRSTASVLMRPSNAKILVVYDVQVKTNEVSHVPLIVNYGMWASSFVSFLAI